MRRTVLLLALLVGAASAARVLAPQRELQDEGECTPRQVHIALSDDPTKMHVSWKTEGSTCRSEVSWWRAVGSSSGGVGGGSAGGNLALRSAVGYSFLLSERDMCSEPAASNDFQLYLHRAVMTDLAPGASYRYQLAGGSYTWAFRAAPEARPDATFEFVAFGDMGESEHAAAKSPGASQTLATIIKREQPARSLDLVLHVGDISYANGDPDIWDSFMDAIEPLAARVPYMVQVGNHEYGYDKGSAIDPSGGKPYAPSWGNYGADSGGECGVMLARRFMMPASARADNPPFWYGFDYGSVHFTAISTEHDLQPGSPQYAWLEAELAAVDRCRTPWLVLLLHRPMYVVYPHKSNRQVGEHIRASIEPLLRRYMVDLTLSGHVHSYYRTCAVFDERCTDDTPDNAAANAAPVAGALSSTSSGAGGGEQRRAFSVQGGGGGDEGGHGTVHLVVGSAGHQLSGMEEGQEEWVVAAERVFGYTKFLVDGRGSMTAEFVESESGSVLDSFKVQASGERLRRACPAAAS